MQQNMPQTPIKINRREFLLFGLAGGGSAALLFSRLFGRSPEKWINPLVHDTSIPATSQSINQLRAEQSFSALLDAFEQPGGTRFKEYASPAPGDPPDAFLWPYLGVVSAAAALSRHPERGSTYLQTLMHLLTGLEEYWDKAGSPPGYDSTHRNLGGGQKYYDDNEWAGLAFLDVFELTGKREHLLRAVDCFRFAASGWTDEMDGGLYWRVRDITTKNTCSNAPAAVLALRLFQKTGSKPYLDWAVQLMRWLRRLRAPDGVYWDAIDSGGQIDRRTFSYNTGAPLHAVALMFQVTQDPAYLDEMRILARAAYEHFTRPLDPTAGLPTHPGGPRPPQVDANRVYSDIPWFNTILLRGLIAMYEADPTHDRSYIDHFRQNLDTAWAYARQEDGTFSPDWTGRAAPQRTWLLDQAGMVECYALASQFD
jgi:hypothetical protein